MSDKKLKEATSKRYVATIQNYKDVFESSSGKKVLKDLMKQFHMRRSSLNDMRFKEEIYVMEGERNVIFYIMDKLKINVDRLHKTLSEVDKEQEELYESFTE